ncbi:MAG: sulfurtransferase complex subunit TusD [Halomonas sp.]|nr:sulfurtransferase complex subunit TusD [Halomonas sp.]TVM07891.1 MAG: sulfurtransferase complex subunit TusD [Halomonas sp.]
MRYGLLVLGAPFSSQAPHSALRFVDALFKEGHQLEGIFFHHDGVFNASTHLGEMPPHEALYKQWCELSVNHGASLDVCVSAAMQRGLINIKEARRQQLDWHNVAPPFELTGIGQLVDLQNRCERFISFAP